MSSKSIELVACEQLTCSHSGCDLDLVMLKKVDEQSGGEQCLCNRGCRPTGHSQLEQGVQICVEVRQSGVAVQEYRHAFPIGLDGQANEKVACHLLTSQHFPTLPSTAKTRIEKCKKARPRKSEPLLTNPKTHL